MDTVNQELTNILEVICEKDRRYRRDAYEFIMEALAYSQKKFRRIRHVTGTELLEGTKELLLNKYGPMALTVVNHWGIRSTEDFGQIVFNLVQNRVLSKSEEDTLEIFRDGFDFQEVFTQGYRKDLERRISRMRSF